MAGIFVELLLSWLLLWVFQRENLGALGFKPTWRRLLQLVGGIWWPILFSVALEYVLSALTHNPYQLNPKYHLYQFGASCLYLAKSVVYENLLFNGAILYLLIKRIGAQKALWVSALAFGIYHWFSWGLFNNPVQMIIALLMTGAGAYVFALAFEKTRSVYLPFALHFGVDFASMILFSHDKGMGNQLLIKTFGHDPVLPQPTGLLFIILNAIKILVIVVYYTWFPFFTWLILRNLNPSYLKDDGTKKEHQHRERWS